MSSWAMEFSTIEVSHDGSRGAITLDRPDKLNPLSTTTLLELVEAAGYLDSVTEVKVVVVSGRGRAFSAGADLAAFSGEGGSAPSATSSREAADAGRRMADAIEGMRAVTVARIQGHCVGGGLVLAAACDLRFAADDVHFSIPEIDRAFLWPGAGYPGWSAK